MILKLFSNKAIQNEYSRRFEEDYMSDELDDSDIEFIFDDIAKIEGVQEMLRSTLRRDRVRYFNAPEEGSDMIKGAYNRTLWLLNKITKKKKNESVNISFKSPRHG